MAMLPPDPIYIFKGNMVSVSCVAFQIKGLSQRIYAGTLSGDVHVWDLKSKREVGKFKAGDDNCLSVCIVQEEKEKRQQQEEEIIITHTKSGKICFWKEDSNQWTLKKLLKIDFFGFCKCEIIQGILHVPIKDSKLERISVEKMKVLERCKIGEESWGEVMSLRGFGGVKGVEGEVMVVIGWEGMRLGVCEIGESGKGKTLSSLRVDECPLALELDEITGRGVCGGGGEGIVVFEVGREGELRGLKRVELVNPGIATLRLRPDRKMLAVGCWDGKLRLFSWKNLVLLAALDVHSSTVQDVSFGEIEETGGKRKFLLAGASQDSRISLWDLYNCI